MNRRCIHSFHLYLSETYKTTGTWILYVPDPIWLRNFVDVTWYNLNGTHNFRYNATQHPMNLHAEQQKQKYCWNFELKKGVPQLLLTGELSYVYCECLLCPPCKRHLKIFHDCALLSRNITENRELSRFQLYHYWRHECGLLLWQPPVAPVTTNWHRDDA